jgi:molybdate transport system substrate-binding protein
MAGGAAGGTIAGISSMATRRLLAELARAYEQKNGTPVTVESVGGVDAARRVRDGEAFDFVVLAADAIDALAAATRVVAGSRVDVARSEIAIAVRAGARRPDIGSEALVRDAVLSARSLGVSTGPSGAHLTRLLERWGVAATVATRIVQAPPGVAIGTLVARGDAELGVQQLSEMIDQPGIDVVGLLPPAIRHVTVFAGGVCSTSTQQAAAAALLAFLASPSADDAKRRHGMAPA